MDESLNRPQKPPTTDEPKSAKRIWQERLFVAVGFVATTTYLAINLVGDALLLPVVSSLVVSFSVSYLLFRRAGKRRASAGAQRILQVITGTGVIAAFALASAFQDLPTDVKTSSIAALLGVTVAGGLATSGTRSIRAS